MQAPLRPAGDAALGSLPPVHCWGLGGRLPPHRQRHRRSLHHERAGPPACGAVSYTHLTLPTILLV
eukprot:357261-Chlamydomonas_euryale.AAC.4